MATVSLHGVRRVAADGVVALRSVDLTVRDGELLAVLAPSGGGKSTLLRVVAGLEEPDDGLLRIAGRDVLGVAPRDRHVILVRQPEAVLSVLRAIERVTMPAELRRLKSSPEPARPAWWRVLLGLAPPPLEQPERRSGQPIRRAPTLPLGELMTHPPAVLLLDDPTARLDPARAATLLREVASTQRATGVTTVIAGNDHDRLLAIVDRVAVMHGGRVEQVDTPAALLRRPATRFVAGFVGSAPMTFVRARMEQVAGVAMLHVGAQRLRFGGGVPGPVREHLGEEIDVGARPDAVRLVEAAGTDDDTLKATVLAARPLGPRSEVLADTGAGHLRLWAGPGIGPARGTSVSLAVDVDALSVFDAASGAALWHGADRRQ